MPGLHDLPVHGRRHERPALESHILEKPDRVGKTLLLEEHLQMHDGERRISHDHVLHPVRVVDHAHEHVLMAAHGVHLLEGGHARPAEVAVLLRGLPTLLAVSLERDAAAVHVHQMGLDALLPSPAFLDREVHVLGGGRVQLMAAQLRTVAIKTEDGLLGLLDDDRLEVQVRDAVDAAGAADVEVEMGDQVFALFDVAILSPTLARISPEALQGRQPVHRFPVQGVVYAFYRCHLLHRGVPPLKDCGLRIADCGLKRPHHSSATATAASAGPITCQA